MLWTAERSTTVSSG